MSQHGLCQICEQRPAEAQCRQCGAHVCDRHVARPSRLCTRCDGDGETPSGRFGDDR